VPSDAPEPRELVGNRQRVARGRAFVEHRRP
jgi:hypothetical protein